VRLGLGLLEAQHVGTIGANGVVGTAPGICCCRCSGAAASAPLPPRRGPSSAASRDAPCLRPAPSNAVVGRA
jgi:hypothetical protein